jgi:RNA polymerase sigma-70 factor (ECF subfamily)
MPSPPLDDDADALLLAPAAAGDSDAFTALFHRHYPAIHAFAYRLALCPAAADDIAQDTFVHAARALASFRRDASFKNWLFAIAANLARDLHRRRSRRAAHEQHLAALAPDPAAEARDHAATDSAHAAVRDALARLSPEHREAVALVYLENLSHAEAARVLDCAETTVSWRLFRARSHLKTLLRDLAPAASRHA